MKDLTERRQASQGRTEHPVCTQTVTFMDRSMGPPLLPSFPLLRYCWVEGFLSLELLPGYQQGVPGPNSPDGAGWRRFP